MRLELTRVGLLVKLANHYTTKGALAEHVINNHNCASSYSADFFTILSQSHSNYHLKVLETVHILTHKPSLCKQSECLWGFNLITN